MKFFFTLLLLCSCIASSSQISAEKLQMLHYFTTTETEEFQVLMKARPKNAEEAKVFYMQLAPKLFMLERRFVEEDFGIKNSGRSQKEISDFKKNLLDFYGVFTKKTIASLKNIDEKFGLNFAQIYLDYKIANLGGLFLTANRFESYFKTLKDEMTSSNKDVTQKDARENYAEFQALKFLLENIMKSAKSNVYLSMQYNILAQSSSAVERIYKQILF